MKKLINNKKGFTLMEVVIAMSLVAVTASFAVAALSTTQRSAITTKEISKNSDTAFSDCESFLAADSKDGDSAGNYVLKKTSGQLGGFPDIDLVINDSLDTTDSDVKFVAFKRSAEDNPFVPSGGGAVTSNGAGMSSGSGSGSGGANGGSSGGNDEKKPQQTTAAPMVETPTQAATSAPVTEAQTQATTAPVTEAETQVTTQNTNSANDGCAYLSNLNMNEVGQKYDWWNGYIIGGMTMKASDEVSVKIGYSQVSGANNDGLLLKNSAYLSLESVYDNSWKGKYQVTIHVVSTNGNEPEFQVDGTTVKGSSYTIPYRDNLQAKITCSSGEVCITGISVEKIGDKW